MICFWLYYLVIILQSSGFNWRVIAVQSHPSLYHLSKNLLGTCGIENDWHLFKWQKSNIKKPHDVSENTIIFMNEFQA